jgi:hypothetical protein
MPNIYVNQINFEFEETPSYHDILTNSGSGSQTMGEVRQTIAHIYVNQVNIEVPVAEVPTDTLTNTGVNTPSIEEVIIGTPVPEPEVVVGGGAGQRIRVIGGRPRSEEDIYVINASAQGINEQILVGEIAEAYAYNNPDIQTKIRKPIYAQPRAIEILSFTPDTRKKFIVPVEAPLEEPKTNYRQKEEEELLLLGII